MSDTPRQFRNALYSGGSTRAKTHVEITVRQTQATDAFRLYFEIGVAGGDGHMLRHKVATIGNSRGTPFRSTYRPLTSYSIQSCLGYCLNRGRLFGRVGLVGVW